MAEGVAARAALLSHIGTAQELWKQARVWSPPSPARVCGAWLSALTDLQGFQRSDCGGAAGHRTPVLRRSSSPAGCIGATHRISCSLNHWEGLCRLGRICIPKKFSDATGPWMHFKNCCARGLAVRDLVGAFHMGLKRQIPSAVGSVGVNQSP